MNTNMSDKNQWRFMEKQMSRMELSMQSAQKVSAQWRRGGLREVEGSTIGFLNLSITDTGAQ